MLFNFFTFLNSLLFSDFWKPKLLSEEERMEYTCKFVLRFAEHLDSDMVEFCRDWEKRQVLKQEKKKLKQQMAQTMTLNIAQNETIHSKNQLFLIFIMITELSIKRHEGGIDFFKLIRILGSDATKIRSPIKRFSQKIITLYNIINVQGDKWKVSFLKCL